MNSSTSKKKRKQTTSYTDRPFRANSFGTKMTTTFTWLVLITSLIVGSMALHISITDEGDDSPCSCVNGTRGLTGFNGTDGATGPRGPMGFNGTDGATGPQGPQGPMGLNGTNGATGPQGAKGQVQDVFPFKYDIFVDGATQVPLANQTGSFAAPFSTIQAALNTIPDAQNASDVYHVYTVLITGGVYDEDLLVTGVAKKIQLIGLGPITLGVLTGSSWTKAIGDTARSITWNPTGTDFSTGVRSGLVISSLAPLTEGITTNESYLSRFRISGDLMVNTTATGSAELSLQAEIFGNLLANTGGILQAYIYKTRVRGLFSGLPNTQFQVAKDSRFDGLVSVGAYSKMVDCQFNGGFTVTSAGSAGIQSDGLFMTRFNGVFTGPALSVRIGDSYTESNWEAAGFNSATLAGGATVKKLYVAGT